MARPRSWDGRLFDAVAQHHAPALDRVLPRLSRSANHSLLWLAVAAGLAATGRRRPRRAALRGLAGIAGASALSNAVLKPYFRRTRPSLDLVPLTRRLHRAPITTSFPSGHSASAAAFATGVAMEVPLLAAPVGALAAAVAYSRIYTGAHYPGDVAAGVAVGAGVAVLSRRMWPVRPGAPAEARPPQQAAADAPALPDGEGLVLVANIGAGSAGGAEVAEEVRKHLPQADVVLVEEGDDLPAVLREAATRAKVLGVAGGDGSINTAAQIALEFDLPLAAVPAGTLNHFSQDVGIERLTETLQAVAEGAAVAVDVACADDAVFLNIASVGGYVDLVRLRERLEHRIGKWPAAALGVARVLRRGTPLDVELDGVRRRLWLVFVGNGHYLPEGFAPTYREDLADGLLDVRIVDATRPMARTRLVAALVTGRLGRSRVYEQRLLTTDLRLTFRSGTPRLARDGEIGDCRREVVFRKRRAALVVYRPQA